MEVMLSTGARVVLLSHTENADFLCEFAGRVCYNSIDRIGKSPSFIEKRIAQGHESIIEHAWATFLLDGISRACAQQITRHRLASFSMESQRYVAYRIDESEDPSRVVHKYCVIPPGSDEDFILSLHQALLSYKRALERGMKKEDARMVLPQAMRTKLVMSANFREWRHVIELRTHPSAQWEIREVSGAILQILFQIAPKTFDDLVRRFYEEHPHELHRSNGT